MAIGNIRAWVWLGTLLLMLWLPSSVWAQTQDPWQQAVEQAQAVIQEYPQFVENLQGYQTLASQIDEYLGLVEEARPFLEVVDTLKQTEIPLTGNAWESLIQSLDMLSPGAGTALQATDQALRDLLAFRQEIRDWRRRLAPLAQAVQAFQQTPSPETLQAMSAAIQEARPVLKRLQAQVAEYRALVADMRKATASARAGLSQVQSTALLPASIKQAARDMKRYLKTMESPLKDLETTLRTLEQRMEQDLEVMDEIQALVEKAERAASQPSASGSSAPPAAFGQTPGTLPGPAFQEAARNAMIPSGDRGSGLGWLLFLLGLVGGGALVYALAHSSRSRIVSASLVEPPSQASVVSSPASPAESSLPVATAMLEIIAGPQVGQRWMLDQPDVLIGRGRDCFIQLRDRGVSRRHARLRYAQGAWFLQDQGSTGGTYVNGKRVQATRLQAGDIIVMGETVLRFFEPTGRLEQV